MVPTNCEARGVQARKWVLAGICWYSLWGTGRPACGQPQLAHAEERLTPKVRLQQYLGVAFPDSARHFVLYYKSGDEDVILFSFDITQDDLGRLLDGKAVFPAYRDLAQGGAEFPEPLSRDPALRHFAQKLATMKNAVSASKRQANPAAPLEVRLWTAEKIAGVWEVCVSFIADRHPEKAAPLGGFPMPAASRETHCYVTIDSRLEHTYDTSIWQRWTLDEAGYRKFLQAAQARSDLVRYPNTQAVEQLADRLNARGPTPELPWWRPSELKQSRTRVSEPLQGFRLAESDADDWLVLVLGRANGVFYCYAHAQRHVLVPDPRDAVGRLLGLDLPASASDVRYESDSSMAGEVSWVRFDLPLRDLVTYLAQTGTLPTYAEFTPDAAMKERLQTVYHAGAPQWWHPAELKEGLNAQRRSDTKDLHDVSVGLGRLPAERVRVYIGAFSAW